MPSAGRGLRFLVAVYSAAFDRDGLHLHMCSGLTRKLLGLHHLRGYGKLPGANGLGTASLWRRKQAILWQDSPVSGIVAL